MTGRLALQRCWHHSAREAVARCPECGHFYCRECVVEHADRIICSGCLGKMHKAAEKPKRTFSFAPVLRIGGALVGVIVAWILFFTAGRMLLSIPDDYHAEKVWKRTLGDDFSEGMDE